MKNRPAIPRLLPGNTLIDSHCHLDMGPYPDDLDQVMDSAARYGIHRIITIGIDQASSRKAVQLASRYPGIYASIGIHPHNAASATEEVYRHLRELAARPKVVGYGEIGLDYAKQYAPVDVQQREFARQLEIAAELNLPLIIHDRDAHADTLALLKQKGPFPASGVMHCFSGDAAYAAEVLGLGLSVSIPGIVTFKNAVDLQDVVREVPLEKLLLETDGPFLAPVPWRGKANRPEYLLYTAEKVADLKGLSLEEVASQTTRNTEKLFSLPHHVSTT